MQPVNNFVVIESAYGKFLLNRHCYFQADALIKTGYTHIEEELTKILTIIDRIPEDGIVVVDGGANAGFFTVPVAQHLKDRNSIVISFEPQAMIFNGLAGTIALNDLDNVRLNRLGLSDVAGIATVPKVDYSQAFDFGTVQITQSNAQCSLHDTVVDQQQVQTIQLDDLHLARLDFFKLDVEGFEIAALAGAKNTITQCRPFLWIEYWKTGLDAINNELLYLSNYKAAVMDQLNVLYAPVEKLQAYGIHVS